MKEKKEKGALWLNTELHNKIKIEAITSNMKLYEFIEMILNNYLENNSKNNVKNHGKQ